MKNHYITFLYKVGHHDMRGIIGPMEEKEAQQKYEEMIAETKEVRSEKYVNEIKILIEKDQNK